MELKIDLEKRKTPLKYDKFKDYYIGTTKEGQQWIFKFKNNYGASVIKHWGSYGFEDDLFELAVLYFDDDKSYISYNNDVTQDVIGWLTNRKVLNLLKKIKELNENGRK